MSVTLSATRRKWLVALVLVAFAVASYVSIALATAAPQLPAGTLAGDHPIVAGPSTEIARIIMWAAARFGGTVAWPRALQVAAQVLNVVMHGADIAFAISLIAGLIGLGAAALAWSAIRGAIFFLIRVYGRRWVVNW